MTTRPISRITLLPKVFHVAPLRAPMTPEQRRERARVSVAARWQAQQRRRDAFIDAERLSPDESRHLPFDFDPSRVPETH